MVYINKYVSENGIFNHSNINFNDIHQFDNKLCDGLINFFKENNAISIADMGCGNGEYVKKIISKGLNCDGYDGNPNTVSETNGLCKILDLSKPFILKNKVEWIMSLEVGEHIPKQYEKIFIDNLNNNNTKGIVISWALPNQGGLGHFNEQPNNYIKNIFKNLNYINDIESENKLRKHVEYDYFSRTVMVFKKAI
jgi:hypothetical protein